MLSILKEHIQLQIKNKGDINFLGDTQGMS